VVGICHPKALLLEHSLLLIEVAGTLISSGGMNAGGPNSGRTGGNNQGGHNGGWSKCSVM
jgi:hypothetical protein